MVEERGDLVAASGHSEGDDAARAVRHVLARELIVFVGFEAGVVDPRDAWILVEELRHLVAVLAVPLHAQSQILKVLAEDP